MKNTSSRTTGEAVPAPQDTDILFGRGGHVNHHPANQRYLALVTERKETYHNCKKVDKASIAWDIIAELRDQDPPPRFLRKDYSTGLWHIVTDAEVRRKISQCLRERATPVITSTKKKSRRKGALSFIKPVASKSSPRLEEREEPLPPLGTEAVVPEASASLDDSPVPLFVADAGLVSPEQARPKQVLFAEERMMEDTTDDDDFVPPPMPAPVSMKQEGSNRLWSDFLTGSFASFTPSMFDSALVVENGWENLLDPASLRGISKGGGEEKDGSFPPAVPSMTSDDEDSSCCGASQESEKEAEKWGKSAAFAELNLKQAAPSFHDMDPVSVDSFFHCDITNLGKVLEGSNTAATGV